MPFLLDCIRKNQDIAVIDDSADLSRERCKSKSSEEIKTCKIAVNKKTNAAFGFVELPTAEAADKFISEYNSNELCGSIVQVSRSHLNERNNSYETMLNML